MLQRDDLDAIIIGTGMQVHAAIAIDAMRAGKHVLSEVSGAMTVDECWGLVRAEKETGKCYMLSENCCYWPDLMMIRRMVQQGVFGETTYAECGYVHDCRVLEFEPDGTLTWRGEMVRDWAGNCYPTHSLGPVAQWMDINRGDRMVSLVVDGHGPAAHADYIGRNFPKDQPGAASEVQGGRRRLDAHQDRQGQGDRPPLRHRLDAACVRSRTTPSKASRPATTRGWARQIWIDGQAASRNEWEPIEKYAEKYEDPLWTRLREQAKGAGHGGGDFFVIQQFLEAVRAGGPTPIDAVDSAAWSCILPLSRKSIVEGGTVQEIPDFSRGKWESARGDVPENAVRNTGDTRSGICPLSQVGSVD